MQKPYLEAGEFVTTHGIEGELKLYPWGDDAGFFTGFKRFYLSATGGAPVTVLRVRAHKNMCIIKLEGVDTVEVARAYIGKKAWIAREDVQLAEGRYFVQDLLGAKVLDADTGRLYGTVHDVTRPGRHDIFEVRDEAGNTYYFPGADAFLKEIDVENAQVYVTPIPGMFDEPAAKTKDAAQNKKQADKSEDKQA